jgi:hypothetical protein
VTIPIATHPATGDSQLMAVREAIRLLDPAGEKFARCLRNTIDQLLDGVHTGRYRWDQLRKTEKTHAGTLVEINLQRDLDFADGVQMDYTIAGSDVDCKYSQSNFEWMIPPEAWNGNHLCLLVWGDDQGSRWTAGLIRATDANLSNAQNRDQKRRLNRTGRERVVPIWARVMALPENVLLRLPAETVARIFAPRYGTKRVDELFRLVQGQIIGRAVVATVGQQADYMKRVRQDGGSRSHLQAEGIIICGHQATHVAIARGLGLPVPMLGEFVSCRVALADIDPSRPAVSIAGRRWIRAQPGDPVVRAPILPQSEAH